jgi:S1-C subfamily serine protease
MENLTKTQLTLLTLLVSFVTSIATGIITVSLLQEAPPGITQTINRVVERTIEKVVPAEGTGVETKVTETIVVKEEDLVIDAIDKNSKSIIRIRDMALIDGVSQFYGIGFLISKDDGIVVSNRRENVSKSTTYAGTLFDGVVVQMKVQVIDETAGLVYLQIIKDPNVVVKAEEVEFATKDLALGQTVIAIEGESNTIVSIGRVTSLDYGATSGESKLALGIETDIVPKTNIFGGPLVNLSGEVVGIRTIKESKGTLAESYTSFGVIGVSIAANLK